MPHIASGNSQSYYLIYFTLIVILENRLVKYACKLVASFCSSQHSCFPVLNEIKQPMKPNGKCQTKGNSVCPITSEAGSLPHFSGKITQSAEPPLKLLWTRG